MKILTGKQINEADNYTMQRDKISSWQLMERAADAIADAIDKLTRDEPLLFVVGKGNNGGDGLAAARILSTPPYCRKCYVFCPHSFEKLEKSGTDEVKKNLTLLPENVMKIKDLSIITEDFVIIDALLGTGVKGELKPDILKFISEINALPNRVISIDIPSGMKTEFGNREEEIIKADCTLTIEFPKIAMLLPEAGNCCGKIIVLSEIIDTQPFESHYTFVEEEFIKLLPEHKIPKFANKYNLGHALLICGQKGMMGAAILAAKGALRSGCGLVTCHVPETERLAIQITAPPVLLSMDSNTYFGELPRNLKAYDSIGIGCGMGINEKSINTMQQLIQQFRKPIVFDADAINILAIKPELLNLITENSILTPHSGELKRLVGNWVTEEEKIEKILNMCRKYKILILLKGAHSMLCSPEGNIYYNASGSAGMAKAGSGDVLTGFITGILARTKKPFYSTLLGCYIHGVSGERCKEKVGSFSSSSSDLVELLRI